MGAVTDQINKLVASGYHEVVLAGVDLSSYGGVLARRAEAWKACESHSLPCAGLATLCASRRSTLLKADEDLIDAIATEQRLMPHLHLRSKQGMI